MMSRMTHILLTISLATPGALALSSAFAATAGNSGSSDMDQVRILAGAASPGAPTATVNALPKPPAADPSQGNSPACKAAAALINYYAQVAHGGNSDTADAAGKAAKDAYATLAKSDTSGSNSRCSQLNVLSCDDVLQQAYLSGAIKKVSYMKVPAGNPGVSATSVSDQLSQQTWSDGLAPTEVINLQAPCNQAIAQVTANVSSGAPGTVVGHTSVQNTDNRTTAPGGNGKGLQ